MLQAGDSVPEITLAKVMVSPGNAPWIQENLIGQVTVFVFFANVYDATEALARRWNESVDRFAGKVHFVMIARDDKSEKSVKGLATARFELGNGTGIWKAAHGVR